MTERKARVITWVSPIGEPSGNYGTRYINVKFSNEEVGYIGKNDLDTAMEVHGLLQERIEKETFFGVEPAGESKKGFKRWKILAFQGYDPKGVLDVGAGTVSSDAKGPQGNAPHLGSTPSRSTDKDEDIRRAVALKAAAHARPGQPVDVITDLAELFMKWLAGSSGTDSPATAGEGGVPSLDSPSPATTSDEVGEGEAPASSGSRRYADNPVPPAFGGAED